MGPGKLRVLVLCTANVCRSPVTAMLLDRALVERGVDGVVRSAGFLVEDEPACPAMTQFGRERGIDLGGHRSRVVSADDVAESTLILTMERRHARELMMQFDIGHDKVFTLGSFAPAVLRSPPSGEGLEEWLARMIEQRQAMDFLGSGASDEVGDPHGESRRVHRKTFEWLEQLALSTADALVALHRL